MKQQELSVAKKYAQAFINAYRPTFTHQELDHIAQLAVFFKQRSNIFLYIQFALLPQDVILSALQALFEKQNIPPLFNRLIGVLISDNRIYFLPDILSYIVSVYKEMHNMIDFVIESAHPLSEEQIKNLQEFLAHKTHKKIYTSSIINKQLIAGIKLYSDTWYWEDSIRKKIDALRVLPN